MNKSVKGHRIRSVEEDSIAWECGIEPGMYLVSINGTIVEDIFDYQFLVGEEQIDVLIREENGEETLLEIEKDQDEDLGIEFENSLMDNYRSCHNKCIFCFIDQMPKGMRETLYFKDDDSRLSFLQGNYVTLTNMSDHDIDRIIRYRMEPINISFQTTNPELRVKMLNNRFAGSIFDKVKRLSDAGIAMNGQIVLCKGWNDGEELDRTIRDLTEYLPALQSVSVVPVGLSRFREGLTPLEPFTAEDAGAVIDLIEGWQKKIWNSLKSTYVKADPDEDPDYMKGAPRHFIHASDEWYLLAGRELPETERYDGFIQYENGVGMLRSLDNEVRAAVLKYQEQYRNGELILPADKRHVTCATGYLAGPYLEKEARLIEEAFPGFTAEIAAIRNDFFGEQITVAGLITGRDLIEQLKERKENGTDPGDEILIPVTMLRRDEEVFLDDVTVTEVRNELQMPVRIVRDEGDDLVRAILGLKPEQKEERQIYEQTDCSNCGKTECR